MYLTNRGNEISREKVATVDHIFRVNMCKQIKFSFKSVLLSNNL